MPWNGSPAPGGDRCALVVGFFGTSIMEHLEAYSSQMTSPGNLPAIGAQVSIEGWHRRGWVHRLALSLRTSRPHVGFDFRNHGEGGATSRDVLARVRAETDADRYDYDLVFLGCGINDVWRRFQGRLSEAVGIEEYSGNLNSMLKQVRNSCRQVVVVSETPFGPVDNPDVIAAMNAELARYNSAARRVAAAHQALYLDMWTPLAAVAAQLPDTQPGVWSDGVHLTELGDTVLLHQAEQLLTEHQIIERLLAQPLRKA